MVGLKIIHEHLISDIEAVLIPWLYTWN